MLSLLTNPFVRMLLPYVLGVIGIFTAYAWAAQQGYKKCQAEVRAAQSEMVRKANKKATKLRKQNDDLSELVRKLNEEADDESNTVPLPGVKPDRRPSGISNSSRMRLNRIK